MGVAVLWLGALVALPAAAGLTAQEPVHGPLQVSEQNPVLRLYHTPRAEGADLIPARAFRIEGGLGYTNVFEYSDGAHHFQLLDMERLTSDVVVRWAPSAAWEVGAGLRTSTDWGGFLDSFISDFHDLFGFPNAGRENIPDHRYAFLLIQSRKQVRLQVPRNRMALDDVRVFAKRALVGDAGEGSALSVRGVVSLGLGPAGVEGGRSDVALELLGRRSFDRTHLHGTLGALTLSPPRGLEAVSRDRAYYLVAGVERQIGDELSLLAQIVGGSSYLQGVGTELADGFPMNLVFGLAGATDGGWGWEVSFAEDVPPGSPSADFTLGVGASRTVGGS